MNEFSATIGLEQLKKLDRLNSKRKQIAKRYFNEIIFSEKMPFDSNCSYHLYWIRVKNRGVFMKNMKHNKLISATEVGPGKVLQALFKKTFRDINTKSLHQIIV